jgi:hypothetical protein
MDKSLIQQIVDRLKSYPSKVFLLENNDRFLYRKDVIEAMKVLGVEVSIGSGIEQRINFELREKDSLLILLTQNNTHFHEDIKHQSTSIEFRLEHYLQGYHIPSIIELDLELLDKLINKQQLVTLNKIETLRLVQILREDSKADTVGSRFNVNVFADELNILLKQDVVNWSVVSRLIAHGILESIGSKEFEQVLLQVHEANLVFQSKLNTSFNQTKNSSAVKKPRIVSKILDFLNFNHRNNKIALIVVDGMALWQYELLKSCLPESKNEEVIYSWLPSITQLSRQAIFRGGAPVSDYRQAPLSEEKLWKKYWKEKGCKGFELAYQHETINLSNLDSITKLAIVFKDLDEKMHGSTDYADLLMLTKNWIERSQILQIISELVQKKFTVFLTSDHGNIQAKGWRGLNGREKLGTNKSGSRSERHIEYSDQWLSDEFMKNNPLLMHSVVREEQTIFFTTDLSFSSKESLVTHGGAHILEVLIPFIEISNES